MPVRAEVRGATPPEFEIIGTGTIGEKARQLQYKTPKLKEIGFYVHRRTVLADSNFQAFCLTNGIDPRSEYDPEIEEKIRNGKFALDQHEMLQRIVGSHRKRPLVVRSSGEGDARGTGIYKSEFVDGTIEGINRGIREVYASYFSPDAIAFRKDAGLDDGLGVIIEPIVGQQIGGVGIAPLLSGYGYTSVPETGTLGAYIDVVPGLRGGVDSRDGERIERWAIAHRKYNLGDYVLDRRLEALHSGDPEDLSSLLGIKDEYEHLTHKLEGDVFAQGRLDAFGIPFGSKLGRSVVVPDLHIFNDVNLEPLFEMMEKTEKELGKRQYIEWVITYEGGEPKVWITQIDDREKQLEEIDFGEGEAILEAKYIKGHGVKDCSKVFICSTQADVFALSRFNQENAGYLLMYGGYLTTAKFLRYKHLSNAAVVIEIPTGQKSKKSISHFGGMIEASGKFFGVANEQAQPIDFYLLDQNRKEEFGRQVYQGRVRVIASELEDRMVVRPLDE